MTLSFICILNRNLQDNEQYYKNKKIRKIKNKKSSFTNHTSKENYTKNEFKAKKPKLLQNRIPQLYPKASVSQLSNIPKSSPLPERNPKRLNC